MNCAIERGGTKNPLERSLSMSLESTRIGDTDGGARGTAFPSRI